MSNYNKIVDYASKDTLASGNPLKVIKGTELNDEFEAIETVFPTKADLANPALTGTPTAPTAGISTDSNQIATTAFVHNLSDDAIATALSEQVYPVGSIYINASNNTNPGTLLGFGTWTSFGSGRVLVGINASDTDFDTAEETGGAKTHTLTTDEMPSHTHTLTTDQVYSTDDTPPNSDVNYLGGSPSDNSLQVGTEDLSTRYIEETGGDTAHNNLQPYIVVHMWKRIA